MTKDEMNIIENKLDICRRSGEYTSADIALEFLYNEYKQLSGQVPFKEDKYRQENLKQVNKTVSSLYTDSPYELLNTPILKLFNEVNTMEKALKSPKKSLKDIEKMVSNRQTVGGRGRNE